MSFFNDFLDYFKIDDLSDKTAISFVIGVGLMIVGKIKIELLTEEQVIINSSKRRVIIDGKELKIKSVAKGELIIFGEITKIDCEG